jgi:hypothetical protein
MNKRSKEIAIKAILARFGGDREQGWAYCIETANKYIDLRDEYQTYAAELLRLELAASA